MNGTGTVLIVTADAAVQNMVTGFVEDLGGNVYVATSTRGGVQLLEDLLPEVVLIDFDLPDNGALAVRRMTNKRHPRCPTVLVAEATLEPEWVLVFECEAEVQKPVSAVGLQIAFDLIGWEPPPAQPSFPVAGAPHDFVDKFQEQPTTPRTVFDRIASRPRLQPYRVRPGDLDHIPKGDTGPLSSTLNADGALGREREVVNRPSSPPESTPPPSTEPLASRFSPADSFVDESSPDDSLLDGAYSDSGTGDDLDHDEPTRQHFSPVTQPKQPLPSAGVVRRSRRLRARRDVNEVDFITVLEAYGERVQNDDPYYLLDLPRNASLKQIRQRHRRIRRELRFDRLADLPPRQRSQAKQILAEVKTAYDQVRASLQDNWTHEPSGNAFTRDQHTGQQRLETLRRLSRKQPSVASESGPLAREKGQPDAVTPEGWAMHFYERAKHSAAAKHWPKALDQIRDALEKTPHDPYMMAFEAWILVHIPTENLNKKLETCANRLSLSLTLDEANAEAHYYLGRVRERQRMFGEALSSYRKALEFESELNKKAIHSRIREIEANQLGT